MKDKLIKEIQREVKALLRKSKIKFDVPDIDIEHPNDIVHGDYSTNIALKLAKPLKKKPLEIANEISYEIKLKKKELGFIKDVQAVSPGFINFYLDETYLLKEVSEINKKKDKYGSSDIGKGKTVVIDYSHPNIAKPIGVHHLPTTLIGDSIKRTYNFLGYKTIADNFLGDWGTQFGKVIYAYKNWGNKKVIEQDPIPELLKLYIKFHDKAKKDKKLDDKAREEFKKLEDGEKENRKLWQWMRDESVKELKEMYETLNITFDYYNGEAFYEDQLPGVINDLKKKKLLKDGEEGAKIVDLGKENAGVALIQKGDGATVYLTRDIAAIKYRAKKYKPEKIIYVVENAQGLHLSQLFTIADKTRYLGKSEAVHVKFGRMSLPEGGMSSRKGKVVLLWKVLEEAQKKSLNIIKKKNPKLKDKEKTARIVGVGAVKYAILSPNRITDTTFTWDKILSLEGNSAPYVMYTYARTKSILAKAKIRDKRYEISDQGLEKEELDILRKLYLFPEVVERATLEYMPNYITTYIYELAQDFNTFYNKLPVLKAEKDIRDVRLAIVMATAQVIKNGMELLGIEVPEKM